jgi:predicted metal-dependent hydrolase
MPVLPGLPPVEITLRRSARARRFSLRVSALDGRVTLSLPARARESEAMEFARSHEVWLRKALAKQTRPAMIGFGTVILFEGREVTLMQGSGRAARLEGDSLLLPGDEAQTGARASAWLRATARDRLAAASDHYAGLLGRKVARLTLRDTRSRWGSCSHEGSLMYWRLIMAPPSVLAYVAAHECAHMVEMNHSAAYWAVVERISPGWQVQRAWLRANGQRLHSYRFDV